MPFDPAVPQPGDDLAAAPLRNQFNALKALVDDQAAAIAALTLRVAALEPPPLTATGFGNPRANGTLIVVGNYDGHPLYRVNNTGLYCLWTVNVWTMQPDDPRTVGITGTMYGTGATDIHGPWTPYAPQWVPAGSVS